MRRLSQAIALTALLVAVTIPHVVEDFRFGEFSHHGIPSSVALVALAIVYALQAIGVALALGGSTAGLRLLVLTGTAWCVGAIGFHGGEILASGPYRFGLLSKGLEAAIIVLGAATAIAAAAAIGSRRR